MRIAPVLAACGFGLFITTAALAQTPLGKPPQAKPAPVAGNTLPAKPAVAPTDSDAGKKLGGIDPVAYARNRIRVEPVKAVLSPFVGVFEIEDAEGRDPDNSSQLFKVSGQLDIRKLGKSNAPLGFLLKNGANLGKTLGMPDRVPVEVSLSFANNEADLAIAFKLVDTWQEIDSRAPLVNPKLILSNIDIVLHAKKNIGPQPPDLTVELAGNMYVRPTRWDPWLNLKPTAELSKDGALTFGGEISGGCAGTPTKETKPEKSCKAEWDVMSLNQIYAEGGTLKLTMQGGSITGLEAALKNGRYKPANLYVNGAVLVDADMTPGAGIALETRQGLGKDQLLALLQPFSKVDPLTQIYSGLKKLPDINASRKARIIVTPTGLKVGDINIGEPTFQVEVVQDTAGLNVGIAAALQGEPGRLLAGDVSGALGGTMTATANFDSINSGIRDAAKQVPGIGPLVDAAMTGFTFHGARGSATLRGIQKTGKATIGFTIAGQRLDPEIPLDALLDPVAQQKYVATYVLALIDKMPEWMRTAINKVPGGAQVLSTAKWAGGKVVEVANNPVGAARDVGVGAYEAVKDPLGTARMVSSTIAGTATDVGKTAVGLGKDAYEAAKNPLGTVSNVGGTALSAANTAGDAGLSVIGAVGGKDARDATVYVAGQAVGVVKEGFAHFEGGAKQAVSVISDGLSTVVSGVGDFLSDPFDRKTGPTEGRTVVFQVPGVVRVTTPHWWPVNATQKKVEYWDNFDKPVSITGVDKPPSISPYAAQKEITLQCSTLQNYAIYDCSNDTVKDGGPGLGGGGTTCRTKDGGVRNLYFNVKDPAGFRPAVTRSLDTIAKLNYACYNGIWQEVSGWATDVGGAANGTSASTISNDLGAKWVIGRDNTVHRSNNLKWEQITGQKAKRIDVDARGNAWIITLEGAIRRHDGKAWQAVPDIPGGAQDIGVGADGSVWALGGESGYYGFGVHRLIQGKWVKVAGAGLRIDVDAKGNAWLINSLSDVFAYTGGGWAPLARVPGDSRLPGNSRDIAIGNGPPWVVNDKMEIYRWVSAANVWMRVNGGGSNISIDPFGQPWVIGGQNRLYSAKGVK